MVRVEDKGSKPQKRLVDIQGVPAEGVIDSGADITIMGADLFKRVAASAWLKKQLKKADKVPHTYDQKTFKLDGKIELDITFQGQTMCTLVYLKVDAHDPLLGYGFLPALLPWSSVAVEGEQNEQVAHEQWVP